MRRKKKIKKIIQPDPRYQNTTVAKLINYIMKDGKKSLASHIVYQAFDLIAKKLKKEALEVFDQAIKNTSPLVEIKSRRIGGAHYQIPKEVRGDRRLSLAIRWIVEGARKRKGKPMFERLAEELIEAANNTGFAVKKKEEVHRMAEANRAFAHLSR